MAFLFRLELVSVLYLFTFLPLSFFMLVVITVIFACSCCCFFFRKKKKKQEIVNRDRSHMKKDEGNETNKQI